MLYPNHIFPFCPPLFSYFFAKFKFLFILYKIGFYFLLYNPVPTKSYAGFFFLIEKHRFKCYYFLRRYTVSYLKF